MAFIQCEFVSKVLHMKMGMNVILPHDECKAATHKSPAVLYLLHGHTDDQSVWNRYTSIERYVRRKNIAVIMPCVHNSFYTNTKTGYDYLTFCGEELPQIAALLFNISSKREDTFVAGASMGGYGAFRLALTYPDKYALAASMSGALNIVRICDEARRDRTLNPKGLRDLINAFGENGVKYGDEADLFQLADRVSLSDGKKPVLRQYCGRQDYLYEVNADIKNHLSKLDFNYAYDECDGNHDWNYWDGRLRDVLREIEKINPTVNG